MKVINSLLYCTCLSAVKLVLFSALGKHFGKVEYNDEQRVASIWDGGEEDVISTEKIYVEELGVSYQKTGRFDLSGCSILKSQY